MKKIARLYLITSALTVNPVMASESADGQHYVSANVAIGSDQVFRGNSQTNNQPGISGGFDYGHASGLYVGIWAGNVNFSSANVNFSDDASIEIDFFAGYANEIGDTGIAYDVSYYRYTFSGEDYSFNEGLAYVSYSYFSVSVAHSANVSNLGETATYYSLGFDYKLPMGFWLSTDVGYYDYDNNVTEERPIDYRVGVSTELIGFSWDIAYTDSNSDGKAYYGEDLADGRIVFTLSKYL